MSLKFIQHWKQGTLIIILILISINIILWMVQQVLILCISYLSNELSIVFDSGHTDC
jgi:hypothetical protein